MNSLSMIPYVWKSVIEDHTRVTNKLKLNQQPVSNQLDIEECFQFIDTDLFENKKNSAIVMTQTNWMFQEPYISVKTMMREFHYKVQ